jgi:hypothetical protein
MTFGMLDMVETRQISALAKAELSRLGGCAIAQAVSCCLPTAALIRFQAKSCVICDGQIGAGASFFLERWIFLPILISPNALYSSATRGWWNRKMSS